MIDWQKIVETFVIMVLVSYEFARWLCGKMDAGELQGVARFLNWGGINENDEEGETEDDR